MRRGSLPHRGVTATRPNGSIAPPRAELAAIYEGVRLKFGGVGVVVSLVIGVATGWPNRPWVPIVTAIVFVHALYVRQTKSAHSGMSLAIDGGAATAASLTMGIPVITVTTLFYYTVVASVLATRRQAIAVSFYIASWATVAMLWSYLELQKPYDPTAKVVIEIAAVVFFTVLVSVVIARVMSTLRSSDTARSDAVHELHTSETRYKTMIENSFDGVVVLNTEGRIVYGSNAIESILGYSPTELIDTNIFALAPNSDRSVLRELANIAFEPGKNVRARVQTERRDGEIRNIEVIATNMMHEPSVGGFVVNFRDITEEVAAEEALIESNKRLEELVRSKDQFVASVSHELRTPLTSVVGLSEMLSRGIEFGEDELVEFHQMIAQEAGEVAAIVEDLLVAARADIGKVAIDQQSISLEESVSEIVRGTAARQHRNITVSGGGRAYADPVRVRQILRNLIVNAVRYGGPDAHITLGGDSESSFVTVTDNGKGIPEPDVARIFEPYESAHAPGGQPGSIGLSLTVSRLLARLMGGELAYERSKGWTTFRLTMPADRPSEEQANGRALFAVE